MSSVTLPDYFRAAGDAFPALLNDCITGRDAAFSWERIAKHDALAGVLLTTVIIIIYSFVWSVVGQNCSKVDQIWSITPFVFALQYYAYYYYSHGGVHNPRLLLITILIILWGLRLTFNFWRRGGYGNFITHEEDYRWPILRKYINNSFLFLTFNITFIASYQNILLMLITLPVYSVLQSGQTSITVYEVGVAFLFVCLLVMETVADQQQYDYQTFKYSLSPEKRALSPIKDIRDGFYQSGLFKYSRHPNYFAEQAIWGTVFLYGLNSNASYWSATGFVLLVLLFIGSAQFSESITKSK
jgi:steroid 5-alpha reductase family enzyme